MKHSHKKSETSLRTKVKQLEQKLIAVEYRLTVLYGFLKEQDVITEGEIKDFIERQVRSLKQLERENIAPVSPKTKERKDNTEGDHSISKMA